MTHNQTAKHISLTADAKENAYEALRAFARVGISAKIAVKNLKLGATRFKLRQGVENKK